MRGARAVTQEDFRLPYLPDDREAGDAVVEDPGRCSVREGHQLEKTHHEDVSHSCWCLIWTAGENFSQLSNFQP